MCGHSCQQDNNRGDVDHCQIVFGSFLKSSSDSPEPFDLSEEAFHKMAIFIDHLVIGFRRRPRPVRWDDCSYIAISEVRSEFIRVEGFVRQEKLGLNSRYQGKSLRHLMDLPRRQKKPHRIAKSIHRRMDLGAQSTAGAANRLILSPPFPPAECWCARTIVPSIIRYSKSGSTHNFSNKRCHTPFVDQRSKRRQVLFQWPISGGRSRQGEPVRKIQRTQSMNSRLSRAVTPRSPSLPGRSSLIDSHSRSLSIRRLIQGSIESESLNHKPVLGDTFFIAHTP